MAEKVISVRLRALVDQYQASLNQAAGRTRQFGSTLQQNAQRWGASLQNVGQAMTLGVTAPMTAMAFTSVKAASDLGEQIDKVGVVFDQTAGDVLDWSKTSAEAMGLSRREALEAAGSFGNLFRTVGLANDAGADMSTTLVQLASDMASFNNEDPSAMLQRLQSGLAGEAEPLRRFGVLLSAARVQAKAMELGIADANQELTEAQKVQARYALILEDTRVQQGNFADTSDQLANKQRRLSAQWENTRAQLGEQLLPLATDAASAFTRLLEAFTGLPGPVQRTAVVLGGVAAAVGPLALGAGMVLRNLQSIRGMLPVLGRGAGLAGKLFLAHQAATLAAQGLTALFDAGQGDLSDVDQAVDALAKAGDLGSTRFAEAADGMDGVMRALDALADPSLAQNATVGLGRVVGAAGGLIGVQGTVSQMEQEIAALDQALATMAEREGPRQAVQAFQRLADRAVEAGIPLDRVRRLFPRLQEATGGATSELELLEQRMRSGIGITRDQADAQGEAARNAEAYTQALKDQAAQVKAMTDPVFNARQKLADLEDAQRKAAQAAKEHGKDSKEFEEAQLDAVQAAVDADGALRELQAAMADGSVATQDLTRFLDGLVRQGRITQDQADVMMRTFQDVASQGVVPLTRDVQGLDSALSRLPSDVSVALNLVGLDQIVADISAVSSQISGAFTGSGTPRVPRAKLRQQGGPARAGMPHIVGEAGPELFIPHTSGRIVPHAQAAPAGRGPAGLARSEEQGLVQQSSQTTFGPITVRADDPQAMELRLRRRAKLKRLTSPSPDL